MQTGDKRKQRWRVIFLCMSLFFLALFCCLWNVLQIQGSFQILFHSMNMKYCITIYFHFLYITVNVLCWHDVLLMYTLMNSDIRHVEIYFYFIICA